jgi:hypothetical protein
MLYRANVLARRACFGIGLAIAQYTWLVVFSGVKLESATRAKMTGDETNVVLL